MHSTLSASYLDHRIDSFLFQGIYQVVVERYVAVDKLSALLMHVGEVQLSVVSIFLDERSCMARVTIRHLFVYQFLVRLIFDIQEAKTFVSTDSDQAMLFKLRHRKSKRLKYIGRVWVLDFLDNFPVINQVHTSGGHCDKKLIGFILDNKYSSRLSEED